MKLILFYFLGALLSTLLILCDSEEVPQDKDIFKM